MIDLPNNVTNNEAYVIRIQGYVGSTAYGKNCISLVKNRFNKWSFNR